MTGINNKTLSGYENGVSEPDLQTLRVLANLYGVSVDWLVGNDSFAITDNPFVDNEDTISLRSENARLREQVEHLKQAIQSPTKGIGET